MAQQTIQKSEQFQWFDHILTIPNEKGSDKIATISFQQATFDVQQHVLPIYIQKIPLTSDGRLEVRLQNTTFTSITAKNIPQIEEKVGNEIRPQAEIMYERKKPYVLVSFVPIRKNSFSGEYEGLTNFDLSVTVKSNNAKRVAPSRNYVDNSVFNQGTLYKFRIQETGIVKIEAPFLETLGIAETVAIDQIRIYGNGGGMLPVMAGAAQYDDLIENPIKVIDSNSNGIFDATDHLLFYAQGPHTWQYDSAEQRFRHQKHLYSDYNYYFLNFDIGAGKRIDTQTNTPNPNTISNSSDYYVFHENDYANLNHSGNDWYGEEFNAALGSSMFNFSIPNIRLNEAVKIATRVAARSTQAGSQFIVNAEGQDVYTHQLSKVGATYTSSVASQSALKGQFMPADEEINIQLQFNRFDAAASGRLDYIALNARRDLQFNGGQMSFRDATSVNVGNITEFQVVTTNPNIEIWDITDIDNVQNIIFETRGNQVNFSTPTETLHEFIAFDNNNFVAAEAVGIVAQQNLHAPEFPDMLIVTHRDFLAQAQELAEFHENLDGLTTKIALMEQIYNEFSSGAPDITALRDFVKMYYDRAGANPDLMPRYLLLFGDASYDFRNREFKDGSNQNFVPTYESRKSIQTLETFCTDDYFGLLDDGEGVNMNTTRALMDIAVGRLPVKNASEAQGVVDKIKHYVSQASLGDWRNDFTFVADDEDTNTHFNHAQIHTDTLDKFAPQYNIDKIYLDAYQQISTPGGGRYPDVHAAINNKIFSGTMVMNYIGHGGENGWAHERILSSSDILKWRNKDKLPLFVTATCSFSRYDDPSKTSAGEHLVLNPEGGAIAIMTTVRLVYASYNKNLNNSFLQHLFTPIDGQMPAIGEIARLTKNAPDVVSSNINNRKFALLGDPALRLAYPKHKIVTTRINGNPVDTAKLDTLRALSRVTIAGELQNNNGQKLTDFNGTVYPTVYDKAVTLRTLANDVGSRGSVIAEFEQQRNLIFKGQARVMNGEFTFSFIVPKDISYQFGLGRISYYAENGTEDANGFTNDLVIGGIENNATADENGPDVDIYLNDESFVFGGLTNNEPVLLINLKDDSGINTVGNGIGHDITAIVDGDKRNLLVLNQYYKAKLDNFQEGQIRFPLSDLAAGTHNIEVKAWDINNNSGKGYTEFIVAETEELALQNVLNYPNPFTEKTAFWFEHNRPGDQLKATVQIFTLSGKLVKTLQADILGQDARVSSLDWNGLDEYGNSLGRGVYIYRLLVRSASDGSHAEKLERLVILK